MRRKSSPLGHSRQREQRKERRGWNKTGGEASRNKTETVEEERGDLNCRGGRMRLKRLDWGDDGCDFTSGGINIEAERCLGSSAEAI